MRKWEKGLFMAGVLTVALLASGYGPHEVKNEETGQESTETGEESAEASQEITNTVSRTIEAGKTRAGKNLNHTENGEDKGNEAERKDKIAKREVVISLAGDCSLGNLSIHGYEGTFREMYDQQGPSWFFKNVKSIFEADDMTLVNFEGVLTNSNKRVEKAFNIKGKPEYIHILPQASIDAVSFGNNHRIDYGAQGIADTVAAFESIDLPYAYDDKVGIFETEDGIKIGIISVDVIYGGKQVETYLQNGIGQLRQQEADLILACCHWGIESTYNATGYQLELGRKCIDWGVDLVVGCHPHVLQGVEYYNGKYIIYSLGNFCFGGNRNPKDKNTMIAQARFEIEDGAATREAELTLIPCTISSVEHRNDYCPTVAEGDRKQQIIQRLNEYSRVFGVTVDEAGRVGHP
ncbi:MAG: CapA family protein [Lachnospiraceae bacterium]|jgi:poly-gamma-glutamate capsule biosynthesis protein CapA/YwtB (metallophosphatase superfamily)|nr:CapA family protein [Lachnospiraceae bacterium]